MWGKKRTTKKLISFASMALNFYSYKTFVIFKSVTFENFFEIMESVGDDANSVFHEDQKNFKSVTFESDTSSVTFKSITFEIFGKCSEIVGDLQEYLKFFQN